MPIELYMIEVRTADWPRALCWYTEVLGLIPLMEDRANRFALLRAGSGRIALKAGGDPSAARDGVRLAFLVEDVDAERARLIEAGEPVGEPVDSPEGYREVRLRDPDGWTIALFGWVGGGRDQPARTGMT